MKQSKPMSLILFSVLALAMSGCGKSNNGNATPPLVNGQVNGYPNGGGTGGTLGSACTSIQGPIPFQGSMYIDSANVIAGQGMSAPQGGYNTTPYGQGQITMTGSGSDGWMTIQAQMVTATSANGAGQLQLSQMVIQQIAFQMQYSGMPYGQVPCASVVAINVGHYNTTLYGGVVRILLNNSVPYNVYF